MGKAFDKEKTSPEIGERETFTLQFVGGRENANPPEVRQLVEKILQSLLRRHLSGQGVLTNFLEKAGLEDLKNRKLEVLGERALERGYVDLLVKEAEPQGTSRQIAIEVKTNSVRNEDVEQVMSYMDELGAECVAGALIGSRIARNVETPPNYDINLWKYKFNKINTEEPHVFGELLSEIQIDKAED